MLRTPVTRAHVFDPSADRHATPILGQVDPWVLMRRSGGIAERDFAPASLVPDLVPDYPPDYPFDMVSTARETSSVDRADSRRKDRCSTSRKTWSWRCRVHYLARTRAPIDCPEGACPDQDMESRVASDA